MLITESARFILPQSHFSLRMKGPNNRDRQKEKKNWHRYLQSGTIGVVDIIEGKSTYENIICPRFTNENGHY